MSIRNRILLSLLFTLALVIAGIGLLGREGLKIYHRDTVDHVRADLLHEGTESFIMAAHQFCAIAENLPEDLSPDMLLRDLAPYQLDDALYEYFYYSPEGTPLGSAPHGGILAELATAADLAAFYQEAENGGPTELTVDNFEAYLEGETETPGIVHLHAYPARQLMLGIGGTREVSGIRLQSSFDMGNATVGRLTRLGLLFYCLIAIAALFLAWWVLEFMFFRPLTRTFLGENDARESGLTWVKFREYAYRLESLQQEIHEIRGRLEREVEARFQAEEERDHLRNKFDVEIRNHETKIERHYAEALQAAETELMRREARVLYRYLKAPIEQAHEIVAAGTDREAQKILEQCLTVVRGLTNEDHALPHAPKRTALQPWLDDLVTQFGQDRGVVIQSNIQNGMHANIDSRSLRPAIEYILENALDVSPHGTTINVDTSRTDEHVEIRIVDHGDGIAADARPHILVPFYSLRAEGDGLGLAITRSVIRQHGGRLDFRSESQKGTAVIVTLPLAET